MSLKDKLYDTKAYFLLTIISRTPSDDYTITDKTNVWENINEILNVDS